MHGCAPQGRAAAGARRVRGRPRRPPRRRPPRVGVRPAAAGVAARAGDRADRARQAPQLALPAGITGDAAGPLRLPTAWQVPGAGPARAAIYGLDGPTPAIELIEVDHGRVVWRDATACAGPIVGVTEDAIVCADASGVRGVTLDGKTAWRSEAPFVAMTAERVVVAADRRGGDPRRGERRRARAGAAAGRRARRVDRRELWRRRARAVRDRAAMGCSCGSPRRRAARRSPGRSPIGAIEELDACDGELVRVKQPASGGGALIALARATGSVTGRVDGVRGVWPARDGSAAVEVATFAGVASWSRGSRSPASRPGCRRSASCWRGAASGGSCARRRRRWSCSIAPACAPTCRSSRRARCSATRRSSPRAGSARRSSRCAGSACRRRATRARCACRRGGPGSRCRPSCAISRRSRRSRSTRRSRGLASAGTRSRRRWSIPRTPRSSTRSRSRPPPTTTPTRGSPRSTSGAGRGGGTAPTPVARARRSGSRPRAT